MVGRVRQVKEIGAIPQALGAGTDIGEYFAFHYKANGSALSSLPRHRARL